MVDHCDQALPDPARPAPRQACLPEPPALPAGEAGQ